MSVIRHGFIRMEISITPDWHKRMKEVCKRELLKPIELARDAIAERVEFLEEKRRKDDELRKAEREAATGRTPFTGFRKMSRSSLTPPAKPAPLREKTIVTNTPAAEPRELPIEYIECAKKIYAAVLKRSPLEIRLCTNEAIAAIKARFPLTSPSEHAITETLERLVVEMREAAAAKVREEVPEMIIDPSKIRTFGNVEPGDDL